MTAGVHPMGDHVARLKATGDACVYLDARHIFDFADRFPTVTAACRAAVTVGNRSAKSKMCRASR
ncbi:hypothetical protein MAHJHV59_47450 [Mycobacterium avium subsp. hominissuis]